jgi:hypothetical protein
MAATPVTSTDGESVVIYQSADREGSTFELSSAGRRLLEQRFGNMLKVTPRIFVAHAVREDFQRLHGSLGKQIVALLTGLPEDQLAGLRLEFRDPVTEQPLS